jgi:2-dehydro-3-deoxyphosphogluconate aldolase/(4S)-4-hydroxy-2-oxoglutarate aldolase
MELVDFARENSHEYIPGISTPTELSCAIQKCGIVKIFPISLLGGIDYIKAVVAPFRMIDFHLVPTGGVTLSNYGDYLSNDKVISCGMSYIVDSALIREGDYTALEKRIKDVREGLR